MKLIPKESKTLFLRISIFFFHLLKSSAVTYKSFQTDIYLFKTNFKKESQDSSVFHKTNIEQLADTSFVQGQQKLSYKVRRNRTCSSYNYFPRWNEFFKLIWNESNRICWLKSQIENMNNILVDKVYIKSII